MKKILLFLLITCLQTSHAAQLVDLEEMALAGDAEQKKAFEAKPEEKQPEYPRMITVNEEVDHINGFIVKTIRNEYGPKPVDWVTETVIIHILSGKP